MNFYTKIFVSRSERTLDAAVFFQFLNKQWPRCYQVFVCRTVITFHSLRKDIRSRKDNLEKSKNRFRLLTPLFPLQTLDSPLGLLPASADQAQKLSYRLSPFILLILQISNECCALSEKEIKRFSKIIYDGLQRRP